MDWEFIAKCVGFESLINPVSMLAAYKDKDLNMELGVIGGKLVEALEKSLSSSSEKGLPLAPGERLGSQMIGRDFWHCDDPSNDPSISEACDWAVDGYFRRSR